MEVLIRPDTLAKMLNLCRIIGARIILEERHGDYIRLIVEKGPN